MSLCPRCDFRVCGGNGVQQVARPLHTRRYYNIPVRILISAGEASGEMYGAQLIKALHRAAQRKPAELPAGQPGAAVPTRALLVGRGISND